VGNSEREQAILAHPRNWPALFEATPNAGKTSDWPNTVRFLPASAHCPRCVEVVRDVPESQIKLDRINFDEYPPPIQGDPKKLVAEWSAKLGLKFDERGHIVTVQP